MAVVWSLRFACIFTLSVLVLTSGRVKRPDKFFVGFDVCSGKYHDFGSSIYFQLTPKWNLSDSFNGRVKVVSLPQVRWTKHGHLCLWLPDIFLYHDLEINPGPNCKEAKVHYMYQDCEEESGGHFVR